MEPSPHLADITIKVPGPFAGVSDLGFSARYPRQPFLEPMRDVPLWIEGPAQPLRRLGSFPGSRAGGFRLRLGSCDLGFQSVDPV